MQNIFMGGIAASTISGANNTFIQQMDTGR